MWTRNRKYNFLFRELIDYSGTLYTLEKTQAIWGKD